MNDQPEVQRHAESMTDSDGTMPAQQQEPPGLTALSLIHI